MSIVHLVIGVIVFMVLVFTHGWLRKVLGIHVANGAAFGSFFFALMTALLWIKLFVYLGAGPLVIVETGGGRAAPMVLVLAGVGFVGGGYMGAMFGKLAKVYGVGIIIGAVLGAIIGAVFSVVVALFTTKLLLYSGAKPLRGAADTAKGIAFVISLMGSVGLFSGSYLGAMISTFFKGNQRET